MTQFSGIKAPTSFRNVNKFPTQYKVIHPRKLHSATYTSLQTSLCVFQNVHCIKKNSIILKADLRENFPINRSFYKALKMIWNNDYWCFWFKYIDIV